ncbi:MAG: hypothetical protein HY907_02125 [Deltaproteobacteria bacterium]|nr:hypothetical protein [Deltaproteobacteria bacterium]
MSKPLPSSGLPRSGLARHPAWLAAAAFLLACGDDSANSPPPPSAPLPTATPGSAALATEKAVDEATGNAPTAAVTIAAGSGTTAAPVGVTHLPLVPDDFIDAPEHRDPFAAFEAPKVEPTVATSTEPLPIVPLPTPDEIAFPDIDIGDLECHMILAMAGEKPRAYLLGPDAMHAYVTQGEYVGRATRPAQNQPDVHWRVYEIEEGGVSFELSNASGQEGDTGVRPALRLYSDDEVTRFEHLFSLR